jgi:hypothetical protein
MGGRFNCMKLPEPDFYSWEILGNDSRLRMFLLIIVTPACPDGFEKDMRMVEYCKKLERVVASYFSKTSFATRTADTARGHPA